MLEPYYDKVLIEAGCDEAGRGCIAGPVVAAAVILPKDYCNYKLNDSKKLSEKQRLLFRDDILNNALAWAVDMVDNIEIDKINILNASFLAMHKALEKLIIIPELILVDGNRFKSYKNIQHICVVKGDSKFMSIAAASVLAKTYRDEYMSELHKQFPDYQWDVNKGYPTKIHKRAVLKYATTPYHRMTFNMTEQLKIEFGE